MDIPCIFNEYQLYILCIFNEYQLYIRSNHLFFAVSSSNNDSTVSGKAYDWRLLGMMPAISKAASVAQTTEWRAERRIRLYHSCIDILVQQINDLTGRDIHIRYADKLVRRSRVLWTFYPWTEMRCPQQLCVPRRSARAAGVPGINCTTLTRCSHSETPSRFALSWK